MKLVEKVLKKPTWSIAFWLLVAWVGLISYNFMPIDLFPDTMPPQITAMTMVRGASAEDVNRRVSSLMDRELQGLTGVTKVVSTSRDEISSVNIQFEFGTDISRAMTDVINAVTRVKSAFPTGTSETQFFRITDANRPIATLALSPSEGSSLDLRAIRLLAANDIKEDLLRLNGIGKVDVFGANDLEVLIRMDLQRLRDYKITPQQVLQSIGATNVSIPGGYLENHGRESLVKTISEAITPEELGLMPIKTTQQGIITLNDVAEVSLAEKTPRSIYRGNSKPAIALNLLKPEGGYAIDGFDSLRTGLPKLQKQYPEITFEITTDQEPIISVNVAGMKDSLFSAVWLTMVVVFLLLKIFSASLIVGISIPLSFLFAFGFLYFTPNTLNMVTLAGLIVAVGMVVDASIVVIENIYRHREEGLDCDTSVVKGAEEVLFSILGGMLTTIVVMIPIMFVGGYVQEVLRPLTMTISATLVGSFIAAITIVPLLAQKLLRDTVNADEKPKKENVLYRATDKLLKITTNFYLSLLGIGLRHRVLAVAFTLLVLAVSARNIMPLVGRELLPKMDTGMATIKVDMPVSASIDLVDETLAKVEKVINESEHVISVSTVVGSEMGQVSFGSGGQLMQQGEIQIRLSTRDKRSETIWQIMEKWRQGLEKIPELSSFSVTEFGATPVATSRAPIDIAISGKNPEILYGLAEELTEKLKVIPGLQDLRLTWTNNKPETHFVTDLELASSLSLTPGVIADHIALAMTGKNVGYIKMQGFNDLPVRAETGLDGKRWELPMEELAIPLPQGDLFLKSIGSSKLVLEPTLVTRENLMETINITGNNVVRPLSAVTSDISEVLKEFSLPRGYDILLAGSLADANEAGERLIKSLALGILMLYTVLYLLFECWWRPLLIMAAIPLSLIGAIWGLVIFDKPMCMPAMMGVILLGGTIVNNAIILIGFIDSAVKSGLERRKALEESVKTRLRPILITTLSTVLGMIPLVFEQAVGLERMSPLGVVAASGLLVGTFLTMVIIPVMYDLAQSFLSKLRS